MKSKFLRGLPVVALAALAWNGAPVHAAPYQRFKISDKFAKTTKVPAKILQMLQKDAVVNAAWLSSRKAGDKSTLASWFTATPLNLNADKMPDLLIKSMRPELRLDNRGPFWIFMGGSLKPALRVNTFALRVLNSSKGGYHDLRSESVNGTTVSTTLYQWDGMHYSVPTMMMR